MIGDRHGVVGGGETFRKRGEARSGFDAASRAGKATQPELIQISEAVAAVHSGCCTGMNGVVICFNGPRLISAALVTLIIASLAVVDLRHSLGRHSRRLCFGQARLPYRSSLEPLNIRFREKGVLIVASRLIVRNSF